MLHDNIIISKHYKRKREEIVSPVIANALLSPTVGEDFIETLRRSTTIPNAFKETVLRTRSRSKKAPIFIFSMLSRKSPI